MKGLGCGVVCGIAGIQSSPVIAVEAAVLDGFGEVLGGDGGGFIEVGDGAGNFEDAVVGPGGEAHASDGDFAVALAGIVESADFADIAGGHAGVVESAGALYGAGLLDAGADFGGRLGGGIAAQFLEGDGWDFDVDIDAIEEGTADLAEIVLDLAWGAAALAGRIAIEPALAGVHGGDQHETRGGAEGHGGAGDTKRSILQRLAEPFVARSGKLGE